MSTVTTRRTEDSTPRIVLHLAFELGDTTWKLGFTPGFGQRPRLRTIAPRDLVTLEREVELAKQRFKLPAATDVVSCYEAGREGFWLHRALVARGIRNVIVDSASIEVNRRARRAKSDRLDAEKLVMMLVRATQGDRRVWRAVRVASVAEEDARQLHRELATVTRMKTAVLSRINGLLATQGLRLTAEDEMPTALATLRTWDGAPLPPKLRARLAREWAEVEHLSERLRKLKTAQRAETRQAETVEDPAPRQMRQLMGLRGLGFAISAVTVREFFGWRQFKNQRQVGGLAGLTAPPHSSGGTHHAQHISKAGNRYVRHAAVELAWCWLRYQPDSALSRWYAGKFGHGGPVTRRIGVVALARKLLIALWRYLEDGVVPEGAALKA
jgi:transposase